MQPHAVATFISVLVLSIGLHSCKSDSLDCGEHGASFKGQCQCQAGYSGEHCEVEDRCMTDDVQCENDGTCEDGSCQCVNFYQGTHCDAYQPSLLPGSYEMIERHVGDSSGTRYGRFWLHDLTFNELWHAHADRFDATVSYAMDGGDMDEGFVFADLTHQTGNADVEAWFQSEINYAYGGHVNFKLKLELQGDTLFGHGTIYELNARGRGSEPPVNVEPLSIVAVRRS